MSRQRNPISTPSIEIELFPFLSVLACTIGSLILLIIVVTAQTVSDQRTITILAKREGSGSHTKTPRYVECRKDGVVIYPGENFVPTAMIQDSKSALNKLLTEISQNSNEEYLIIAVRPEGIELFDTVRELAKERKIDIGYEPIDEGWQLRVKE